MQGKGMLAWEGRDRNRQNVSLPPHPVQSGPSLLNGSVLPTLRVGLSHSDHWHTCNSSRKHPCRHSHDLPVHSIQSYWHPKPTFRGKRHTLGRKVLLVSLAGKCCSAKGCAPVSKRTIDRTRTAWGSPGPRPCGHHRCWVLGDSEHRTDQIQPHLWKLHMGLRRP